MSRILSDQWDNVLLNDIKEEAIAQIRQSDPSARATSVHLFDNDKMASFKADAISVESGERSVLFVSKASLAAALDGDVSSRADIVAKTQAHLSAMAENVKENKNSVTIDGADFKSWLEVAGLSDVASALDIKPKSAKM